MGSSSKGATTTQSSNSPPPEVMAQYEQLMARANQVASTPYQAYTGQQVAGFTPDQSSAFGTVNNAQGITQPYFNTAQDYAAMGAAPISAAQIQNYSNPYQNQVINATLGNLNELNSEQQANLTSGTLSSGGLFNDRLGVAQSTLARQQDTAEAPTIAGLNASNYSQALNAAQADRSAYGQAAYTFGNLGTANLQDILSGASAQLGTGGLQQQLAQAELNVPYQQFLQQQAFPYQQTGWLSSLSTGLGSNMGGTSTSTTTPPGPSGMNYAGLGLAAMALLNRGGGINRPHRDDGGAIPGAGGGISLFPYGNVQGYIPGGLQIAHGSGPPKPAGAPSGGANPADSTVKDALGLAEKKGSLKKGMGDIGSLFGFGGTDPSIEDAQQAGLSSGLSADEVGIGDFEAFRRGGRTNGIHLPAHMMGRRHYDEGGDVIDDDYPLPDDSSVSPGISTPAPSVAPSAAPWRDLAVTPAPSTGFTKPSWAGSVGAGDMVSSRSPAWPTDTDRSEEVVPPKKELTPYAKSPVVVGDRKDALSYGAGPVDIERAKRAIGTFESGNNYQSVGPPTHLGRALGRYQVMEKELPGQLRQAGLPPMSPQEFLHDPKAQDKLFETVFGGLMDKHGNFNDAASVWFSGRPVAKAGNARDVLGTTVPQYLANTNAILARDDGANPTYGGSTAPAGPRLAFTSDDSGRRGIDRSVADTSDTDVKSRDGHLFSPETRSALLHAGFAMLSNRSPYAVNAIGAAGEAGLSAYETSKRYNSAQNMEERKFKLSEKQVNSRIDQLELARKQAEERIALATKANADTERYRQDNLARQQQATDLARRKEERAEAEGHYSIMPGTGAHPETGEQVPGVYKLNSKTGETSFVPGVNLTAKPKAGAEAPLPDEAWTKHGDDFLNHLPPGRRGEIKAIADYEIDPKSFAVTGGGRERALAEAKQYDPSFNQNVYNARYQAVNKFATGPQGNNLASLNTSINHLDTLGEAIKALNNKDYPAWNRLTNYISTQFGYPAVTNFEGVRDIVADELVKSVIGQAGSEGDRENMRQTIRAAGSPAQLAGIIEQYQHLMGGRLDSLRYQFKDTTGLDDEHFYRKLAPATRERLRKFEPGAGGGTSGGAGGMTPKAALAPRDQQALDWANAHPGDPRSQAIKQKLGVP